MIVRWYANRGSGGFRYPVPSLVNQNIVLNKYEI